MQQAVDDIRMRLFTAIGYGRWSLVANMRGSDLNHALSNDVDRIQVAVFSLMTFGQNIIWLTLYGLLSTLISWQMTLFAMTVGAATLFGLYPVRRKIARCSMRSSKASAASRRMCIWWTANCWWPTIVLK